MTLKAFNNQQLKSISNFLLSREIRLNLRRTYLVPSNPIATVNTGIHKLVFENKTSISLPKKYFATNVRHTNISSNTNFEDNNVESSEVDQELSKTCLYDDNDKLIRKLNFSENTKELLNNMNVLESSMELKHYVQCIFLLWNFSRSKNYEHSSLTSDESIIEKSLNFIEQNLKLMSSNELSCSYLYLRKMNVPNCNSIMQKILIQALYNIKSSTSTVPLSALSRLVVGINTGRDFFTPLVCKNFIPHVIDHINTFNTDEDARLLSICIFHLHPLIDTEILSSFKNRIQELLDNGVINAGTPKCILKILNTLNFYVWSQQNSKLIRNLMFVLGGSLPLLDENELKVACRIFQFHYEPNSFSSQIKAAIQAIDPISTPETLACIASVADPQQREPLIAEFKNLLLAKESWDTLNASGFFFLILRTLKISDVKLCDAYWKGVVREVGLRTEEETQLRFLRHCNRYMNFNNNLGGTYRFLTLERKLSAMAMNAIENDIAGRIPSKFSRLAAFVLAYGHTPQSGKKFPNIILSKIITMSEQFSIIDCFFISRGLQIAQELRFRHHTPTLLGMQLSTIDNILITCAERHLRNEGNLTPTELNAIVRTLSNRKSLKSTVVFQEALNRFKKFSYNDLNSRSIRDMAYNFISSSFIVPETLESMFKYIEVNNEHVMGETVERILTCAYHLGYTPESNEAFEFAAQIIIRDFSNMSGLSILQACLALCYYKRIPEILINKVFCVKFIQRIEDEIQMCYSKATYPERVLNVVMQLNRTVCLDFPESNVPWFQQNYIEAQLSKKPVMQSAFSENIRQFLTNILKDEKYFRCNHTTPYGYQIDFVIHFDGNKSPIAPVETTMLDRITKVAILLLKLDSFCENDLTSLRGPESLKMKHLEMMGYKVIHITEHDWNSKYLNAPEAKTNYLKCLLQIQN